MRIDREAFDAAIKSCPAPEGCDWNLDLAASGPRMRLADPSRPADGWAYADGYWHASVGSNGAVHGRECGLVPAMRRVLLVIDALAASVV